MAKSRTTKATKASQKAPETTPADEGWEIVGNVWDEMHMFKEPGDEFFGVFLSTGHKVGPNSSQVHIFQVDDKRIGLWGSSALDQRMKTAKSGHLTKIRYDSLALSAKSGREYKDFQVWQQSALAPGYSEAPTDDIPF